MFRGHDLDIEHPRFGSKIIGGHELDLGSVGKCVFDLPRHRGLDRIVVFGEPQELQVLKKFEDGDGGLLYETSSV
jgi:hypothetical protein